LRSLGFASLLGLGGGAASTKWLTTMLEFPLG
jgi:hypothetical protein